MSEKKVDFKDFLNVYDFTCELQGTADTIVFKPITTGQLKRLLTFENSTDPIVIDEALDQLITSSVTSEGFDVRNLYLQDRFSLLIEIRKATKGNIYEFTHVCRSCNSQNMQTVNLNKLEVIPYPEKINHVVKLTDSISIELDNIKRGEQISAYRNMPKGKMNEFQKLAEMGILTHAAGVKSVITPNGTQEDLSFEDRKYLIENIPTTAYDLIKDWYADNDFGIDFSFEMKCRCGHEEIVSIPMENFFF